MIRRPRCFIGRGALLPAVGPASAEPSAEGPGGLSCSGALHSIVTAMDDVRIGASRLVAAGWSIKLLAVDSLSLQRATIQLRQALARFLPVQDHQARIFGLA